MRKREAERYRSLLEAQLASLLGQGERAVHEMVDDPEAEAPDPNDRATVEESRNWSLRLRDRDRKLIAKIHEALGRLDQGEYGYCAECAGEISAQRLRALPFAVRCTACESLHERDAGLAERDRRVLRAVRERRIPLAMAIGETKWSNGTKRTTAAARNGRRIVDLAYWRALYLRTACASRSFLNRARWLVMPVCWFLGEGRPRRLQMDGECPIRREVGKRVPTWSAESSARLCLTGTPRGCCSRGPRRPFRASRGARSGIPGLVSPGRRS